MTFNKQGDLFIFEDYKSFFKFINNYEGDLTIRKWEVFSEDKLIAVFNHGK